MYANARETNGASDLLRKLKLGCFLLPRFLLPYFYTQLLRSQRISEENMGNRGFESNTWQPRCTSPCTQIFDDRVGVIYVFSDEDGVWAIGSVE